jgi:hypothetical protein
MTSCPQFEFALSFPSWRPPPAHTWFNHLTRFPYVTSLSSNFIIRFNPRHRTRKFTCLAMETGRKNLIFFQNWRTPCQLQLRTSQVGHGSVNKSKSTNKMPKNWVSEISNFCKPQKSPRQCFFFWRIIARFLLLKNPG